MTISIIISIVIIFISLILSAIFSASETAIVASARGRLNHMAKNGDKRAAVIIMLRRHMGKLISSLLVGNQIVNTASAAVATGVLTSIFGNVGIFYATIVMSILIILYSEVMPKLYAVNNPEKTATYFSGVLKFLFNVLSPITRITDFISRHSLRLFGVNIHQEQLFNTEEELRGLIEMHVGPDEDSAQERAMLRSILDLGSVNVGEIMIHRKNMFMLNIEDGIEKIIKEVLKSSFTRIPLYRDQPNNIVGILHTKVLFRATNNAKGKLDKVNLDNIINKPWFVPETTDLLEQLQEFRKRKEHFSIVVDEYGELLGIVTLEDVLEEIVGEIVDEHDVEIPGVRVAQDGSMMVSGTVTIRNLNRQFEWELPDEEASTIAGLLIHDTRCIPEKGQSFNLHGFKFEVIKKNRNQITLIRITPLEETQE